MLGRQEVPVPAQHVGGGGHRPDRRAGDHVRDRVQPERERGDDPEVAAPAAQRPEQVGVLALRRGHDPPVGEHDLRLEQVVDGEPVLARQVAVAAAQREAADPGRRDDPGRRGQTVLVRRGVDAAPGGAALHADRPRARIDHDLVHRGQVDDQPVVDGAEPGAVVAATANGDGQPGPPRRVERGLHVGHGAAAGDDRRPPVDHRVVDRPGVLVAGVVGRDDLPAHPAAKLGRLDGGHGSYPFSRSCRFAGDDATRGADLS